METHNIQLDRNSDTMTELSVNHAPDSVGSVSFVTTESEGQSNVHEAPVSLPRSLTVLTHEWGR